MRRGRSVSVRTTSAPGDRTPLEEMVVDSRVNCGPHDAHDITRVDGFTIVMV